MLTGVSNNNLMEKMDHLFSEILIAQRSYDHLREADPDKTLHMQKLLDELTSLKGKPPVFPYISTGRGHGPFTELVDGSVKYDLIGAIGPNLLGHSHPLYIKAHLEAATSDVMTCGNLLPYQESLGLSKELLSHVKSTTKLSHFWFTGSGSFANDTALKMIWQKKAPRYKVLAFQKAFAGRSIATQDITFNQAYREGMPRSIEVTHIPHFNQNQPEVSLENTLKALDAAWSADPDSYCAIMIELIQGEAGFVYGTSDYYKEIFKWAKAKNLYIWVDEVQSFARTTELFAFQAFKLEQYVDIVTVGKALQACGVLYSEELNPKPGLIAGTFNGSIAALNAGEKIVHFLTNGNFYGEQGRMKELETIFIDGLKGLADSSCKNKIPYVGGIGTMISFEVGDASKDISNAFIKQLFNNGIISFTAGSNPTRIRFLIPISLKPEHISEIFNIIEKTIHEVVL